jgi:hypothetical protein
MKKDLDPLQDLPDQLHLLLLESPDGFSEYQLIQQLKARHCTHIPQQGMDDRLVLFRTHFLLFNALYQLRNRLMLNIQNQLQISPLCIRLIELQHGKPGLSEHDALAGYYLDMDNLRTTTEQDVARLLESFWSRMQGGDEKRAALELFELDKTSAPLDIACIKRRYRQLVSLHHPDRGGNTSRLQSINKAMEILNRYYK